MRLKWFFVLAVIALPAHAEAWSQINLPYSTSALNCSEFSQVNAQDDETRCDNVNAYGSWMCTQDTPSKGMQITSDANYPGGAGGKGFRIWYGDTQVLSSSAQPDFIFQTPPQEIWVRAYVRWAAGANFDPAYVGSQQKLIYFWAGGPGGYSGNHLAFLTENPPKGDQCAFQVWGGAAQQGWRENCGYMAMGASANYPYLSQGNWTLIEFHVKLESQRNVTNDGIMEYWINGVRKIYETNLRTDLGQIGRVLFPSNIHKLANGACTYYDIDDIAFSTTGRIGAIGSPATLYPRPPAIMGVTQ